MCVCLSFLVCSCGSSLYGALDLPESWLPQRNSSALVTSALTVGMLHRSVFWLTGYPQLPCLSIQCASRMQGCSERNYRAKEREKWATSRSTKIGNTCDSQRRTMHRHRYLPKSSPPARICVACRNILPLACVSFNLLKQSEWRVLRAGARRDFALLRVIFSLREPCTRVFEVKYANALGQARICAPPLDRVQNFKQSPVLRLLSPHRAHVWPSG